MLMWDYLKQGVTERRPKAFLKAILLFLLPILCTAPMIALGILSTKETVPFSLIRLLATAALLFPNVLTVEGGVVMVLLGLIFYVAREKRWVQIGVLLGVSALLYVRDPTDIQWMMAFAALPMARYNGKKGAGAKHFFYFFYPAHIYGLYLLSTIT